MQILKIKIPNNHIKIFDFAIMEGNLEAYNNFLIDSNLTPEKIRHCTSTAADFVVRSGHEDVKKLQDELKELLSEDELYWSDWNRYPTWMREQSDCIEAAMKEGWTFIHAQDNVLLFQKEN